MAKSSSTYRRAGLLLALKGNRYALRQEYGIASAYYQGASKAFELAGMGWQAWCMWVTADRYEYAQMEAQRAAYHAASGGQS